MVKPLMTLARCDTLKIPLSEVIKMKREVKTNMSKIGQVVIEGEADGTLIFNEETGIYEQAD